MQEDRFQVLTFRKPKERCPLCTTHQPDSSETDLGEKVSRAEKRADPLPLQFRQQQPDTCARFHEHLSPEPSDRRSHRPPRPWLGATARFRWQAGSPCHISAPLATTADPRRGSSLGSSGYVSGSPSGLQKADTTRVNRNRDLETYKHSCVLLSDTDGWGKGPLSFFRLAHR